MKRSGRRSTRSTRNPRNNGLRAAVVNVGRFFEVCIEGQEGVLEVKVYKTREAKISHSTISCTMLCAHRRSVPSPRTPLADPQPCDGGSWGKSPAGPTLVSDRGKLWPRELSLSRSCCP